MLRSVARQPTIKVIEVDLAATANVNLANPAVSTVDGLHRLDGTVVQDGWRVAALVQSRGADRGVYIYNLADNSYSRSPEMPTGDTIYAQLYIHVLYGLKNAERTFQLSDLPALVGTDVTTWTDVEVSAGLMGANCFVRGPNSPIARDAYGYIGPLTSQDMPPYLVMAGTIPNVPYINMNEEGHLERWAHANDLYDQSDELDDLLTRYNTVHLVKDGNTQLGRAISTSINLSGKTIVCYGRGLDLPGAIVMLTNARLVEIGGSIGLTFKNLCVGDMAFVPGSLTQNFILGSSWFSGFKMDGLLTRNYKNAFNCTFDGHGGYEIGSALVSNWAADASLEVPVANTYANNGKGRVGRLPNFPGWTIRNNDAAETLFINKTYSAFIDDQTVMTGNHALTLPATNVPDGQVVYYKRSVSADTNTVSIKDDTSNTVIKTVLKNVGAWFRFDGATNIWKYAPPGGT